MIQVWQYISIFGFILGGLMLIIAALLFWKDQIPKVIGALTGKTAKKAIEDIKKQSETGVAVTPSAKGSAHDPAHMMSLSGNLAGHTEALSEEELAQPVPEQPDYNTPAVAETALLSEPAHNNNVAIAPAAQNITSTITVISDITFIHTDEVIA